MIVEFSVKNFRSIKELQTISFVATGLKSPEQYSYVDKNNIAKEANINLLKTVGIYGSNGSGKSNIIRALEYFINVIIDEISTDSKLSELCDPFFYQDDFLFSESYFQIVFILNNKKYRYGFTVKRKKDGKQIKEIINSEWLFGQKEKNISELFIRQGLTDVKKDKSFNSGKVPDLQYEHTLFLTHASAFDKKGICASIRKFFISRTISNFTNEYDSFRDNTLHLIEHENKKEDFLELLCSFNLKYKDVFIERDDEVNKLKTLPQNKIFLSKEYIDKSNNIINFRLNLKNNESAGTQKLFDIAGLLLRAFNMEVGGFIILDEVDSNFHPALLIKVIELFNDPEINKNNCQLLFTSHDTNLMDPAIMRRDQFYFTEKNEDDSTRLYSLSDLKGIRNDADFAKQYLAGFYGAMPVLGQYVNKNTNLNDGALEY